MGRGPAVRGEDHEGEVYIWRGVGACGQHNTRPFVDQRHPLTQTNRCGQRCVNADEKIVSCFLPIEPLQRANKDALGPLRVDTGWLSVSDCLWFVVVSLGILVFAVCCARTR